MLPSSKKISELQAKVEELEGQLSAAAETHKAELIGRDRATEELTSAHTAALQAKETEIADLKAKVVKADQAEEKFEERVNTEVVRRCAAAGLKTPIIRNPDVNTDEDLVAIREKMAASTDPKERFALAQKARELRLKKAA